MDSKLIILIAVLVFIIGAIVYQSKSQTSSLPPQNSQDTITLDSQDNTNQPDQDAQDTTTEQKGGDTKMQFTQAPKMEIDAAKTYTAVIKTNKGDITVALTAKETPKTVNNFVFLAKKGFYDGTIFHRVIQDFMIQGGDPTGTGTGGPGYRFEDEFTSGQTFDAKGVLAMANAGPNTNGSQFFITHAATTWLDGKHTIFGKVVKGIEIVDTIAGTQVGAQDKPVENITISTIEIQEK